MNLENNVILEENRNLEEAGELSESGHLESDLQDSPVEVDSSKTKGRVDASISTVLEEDDDPDVALMQETRQMIDSLSDEDKNKLKESISAIIAEQELAVASSETNNSDEPHPSHSQSREAESEAKPPKTAKLTLADFGAVADKRDEQAENYKFIKSAVEALKPFENRSDAYIAELVVAWFGEAIANCRGIGILTYNNRKFWEPDEDNSRLNFSVQRVIESLSQNVPANRAEFHKWLHKCQTKSGLAAIVAVVKARARRVSLDDLDADPVLLNVANGTLNIATGTLQPHDPSDLITCVSPVVFNRSANCPRFEQAILKICNNDPALVHYVRKVFGYALTGLTLEQFLFMFVGDGSNGKSLLLELFQKILGTYHQHTPASTFLRGSRDSSRALAILRGARMVTLSETERDARWNQALLKAATGDTHLTGIFLGKEEIPFTPRFKLFLVSNFEPKMEGHEHGLWRRFQLIKCKNRFWDAGQGETGPAELKADKNLAEQLEGELSGILNWAIRGYTFWQKEGLQSPQSVQEDNLEYRRQNDSVSQFMEDRVELVSNHKTPKSDFYEVYKNWASENGFAVLVKNDVGKQLVGRAVAESKSGGTRFWQGVKLKDMAPEEEENSAS